MKKSKILIPALSVASVGAVVAPLVTSCNSNTAATLELDVAKASEFKPSGEQLTGEYNDETMTTKFYEFIKSNPKYLAEEILMGSMSQSDEESVTGTAKVWINNIDTAKHTVSFKIETNATYSETNDDFDKMHMVMEYVNIPYAAQWYTPTNADSYFRLACTWDEAGIKAAKDWKFYTLAVMETTEKGEKETIEMTANADSEDVVKEKVLPRIQALKSHYMAQCTHKA